MSKGKGYRNARSRRQTRRAGFWGVQYPGLAGWRVGIGTFTGQRNTSTRGSDS